MKKILKRIAIVTLMLTLAVAVLAACGGNSGTKAPDSAPATGNAAPAGNSGNAGSDGKKEDSGTDIGKTAGGDNIFTVGFDANFPPYGYVGDDGEYTGFDLELAAEVAKRNGWELALQPIDWDAKDFELESGTIDCVWNGFTINGRESKYTWTDAYMDNSQIFVVKSSSGINTYADLAGKIVAAQTDSAALNVLQSEERKELTSSFKELVVTSNYNAAFMDLEAGAVDAIAMDIGVAKFQIQGRESEFKILDEILYPEKYGVGFKLGNTALRDVVQATLLEMVKDETFAEISNKWFGYDVGILGK